MQSRVALRFPPLGFRAHTNVRVESAQRASGSGPASLSLPLAWPLTISHSLLESGMCGQVHHAQADVAPTEASSITPNSIHAHMIHVAGLSFPPPFCSIDPLTNISCSRTLVHRTLFVA